MALKMAAAQSIAAAKLADEIRRQAAKINGNGERSSSRRGQRSIWLRGLAAAKTLPFSALPAMQQRPQKTGGETHEKSGGGSGRKSGVSNNIIKLKNRYKHPRRGGSASKNRQSTP